MSKKFILFIITISSLYNVEDCGNEFLNFECETCEYNDETEIRPLRLQIHYCNTLDINEILLDVQSAIDYYSQNLTGIDFRILPEYLSFEGDMCIYDSSEDNAEDDDDYFNNEAMNLYFVNELYQNESPVGGFGRYYNNLALIRDITPETNRSWSIDDYRNKFQFGCEYGKLIENGKLTKTLKNPNYRAISNPFWNSLKMLGNSDTFEVYGTPYCGKGEPNQAIRVGHASPVCLFENVEIFGGV